MNYVPSIAEPNRAVVPTALWLHVNLLLGSPPWLRRGTQIADGAKLPPHITLEDDVTITRNVFANADLPALIEKIASMPRPPFGPGSAAYYLSAPNLDAAFRAIASATEIESPFVSLHVSNEGTRVHLDVSNKVDLGELNPFVTMLAAIWLSLVAKTLIPGIMTETSLLLRYPASAEIDALRNALAVSVEADSTWDRLSFPCNLAGTDNPEHDELTWRRVIQNLDAHSEDSLTRRLQANVAQSLTRYGRVPTLEQLANAEGISPRSLNRTLSSQGLSFRSIVKSERKRRALELIDDPHRNLDEIAQLLDFAGQSSFGRAFRDWFDESPGSYRQNRSDSKIA